MSAIRINSKADATAGSATLARVAGLLRTGHSREAVATLKHIIRAQPANAPALNLMGKLALRAGEPARASLAWTRSIAVNFEQPDTHCDLGDACFALLNYREAADSYNNALELDAQLARAWTGRGRALHCLADFSAADLCFAEAEKMAPDSPDCVAYRALSMEECNQLSEARQLLDRGLALAPEHPVLQLVQARAERRTDAAHAARERLLALDGRTDLEPWLRRSVNFDLVRVHDILSETDDAFARAAAGNALVTSDVGEPASECEHIAGLDRQLASYSEEFLRSWARAPLSPSGQSPVFLIGFPRSGSVLLSQILGGRPHFQVLAEPDAMHTVRLAVDTLTGGYPDALARLTGKQAASLQAVYYRQADKHVSRRPDATLIDMSPLNTARVALIHRVFPDARFVFATRHPYDVVLSCFLQDFPDPNAAARYKSLDSIVQHYERTMNLFQRFERVLPIAAHRVRYEDLVQDPESETRRLFNFLGAQWDPTVVDHTAHARSLGRLNTPGYDQVVEPIYRRARFRWRRYQAHLAPYLQRLAPFVSYLNYDE